MTISEIYALAALMGLHLSESSHHERAYRDLIMFIDETNALTIEEVLKIGLKYSRDRPSTANAYRAMLDADSVCNCACPLCCKCGIRRAVCLEGCPSVCFVPLSVFLLLLGLDQLLFATRWSSPIFILRS
jgi:hypothetical protein